MPDYVMKHKSKDVGDAVLSLPEGTTADDAKAVAKTWPDGWSLDVKSDPAEVLPPETPAVPADKK